MSTEDTTALLAQLRDIHLPQAPAEPSLWPVIVASGLCLLAAVVVLYRHKQNKSTWSHEALHELRKIEEANEPSSPATLQQTAALLKRIVISSDPAASQINGDRWLAYLDRFFGTSYFTTGKGRVFGTALYQPDNQSADTLHNDLKKLIRRKKWQQ